jgi:signal transduction histidine kinase
MVALERTRLRVLLDQDSDPGPAGAGYLALRGLTGLLGGYAVICVLFLGLLFLAGAGWAGLTGRSDPVPLNFPGVRLSTDSRIVGLISGIFLIGLGGLCCYGVVAVERLLAARFLGPGTGERMRRRIAELTTTRSGIVRAVDDERRRIERDLHDGVQQRGVALAMLLGRARHDPGAAADLLGQAYELRSVAWRIYPTALDELGLRSALDSVAEWSSVPVTIQYGLAGRPVSEVETALYFVTREAITNAVKHARAHGILVVLSENERTVSVVISDDGQGGADPSGAGLSGLARRVLALDGTFEVTGSEGGGTRVCATLPKQPPCG